MKYWYESLRIFFTVVTVVLSVFEPCTLAQQTEDFKLLASDGGSSDFFGGAVSISGHVAIVGTRRESAYIYRFSGSEWVEETKLVASDRVFGDRFGQSVSISGPPGKEVAIVGANRDDDNGENSGSAYIYRFNGATWVQEQKLLASDGVGSFWFGWAAAISGSSGNEVAIVGVIFGNNNGSQTGSAYIYRFNGVTWVQEAKLLALDGLAGDRFGQSVSICGPPGNEVAIIGAYGDDDNGSSAGSAYIFRKSGSAWIEEAKLLASDGVTLDDFGESVSICGPPGNEVAIVGKTGDDDKGSNSGSAYIYRKSGSAWVEEAKLHASDGAGGDYFGVSVSIGGSSGNEVAIIGAYGDDDNGSISGSVYIFRKSGSAWVEETKLLASDGASLDIFGVSVSISGPPGEEVVIVGASQDDDSGSRSGSAYLFNVASAPCPGDFDNSGAVNVSDLLTLLSNWGPNPGSPADTNNDGIVNVFDLLLLLAAWGACP